MAAESSVTAIPTGEFGARADGEGTGFALYSSVAEAVELCLFDAQGTETARHTLEQQGDAWYLDLPNCVPGQHYGYRVHGPYDPAAGLRCNPHKLLIDPWARQLDGYFIWNDAVTGYADGDPLHGAQCTVDSAPFVPKSVVPGVLPELRSDRPRRAWQDSVICELNVRGYTMRHPGLSDAERGRFAGLANGEILDYLKALGITTVELLPVHTFIDERFLDERGLRNYWGYNSISFFTPAARYAGIDPVCEFREMVDAIHDAGLEVILDVVYNHTGETDEYGPTLSFRGIDNQAYYRVEQDDPARYVNDTGCGNTLNADHPITQALVVDSLEYWARDMGVDGFRFDLAPVLGRHAHGFDADHPLLTAIAGSHVLSAARLIAEPWDIGPGGYQAGAFGPRWSEWNDDYRDTVRRFWRGDKHQTGHFARVVHGSAARFEHKGVGPGASVNFVTSHDGYTLADLVSYEQRHNHANGHDNADGHSHNYGCNHGHEGPSDDPEITALRRRQRLNMLATLLVSGGVPMLLGGDEFGHSQHGNNNAYCQDNELTWLNWNALEADSEFAAEVAAWIALRRSEPLLRPAVYRHGEQGGQLLPNVSWWHADGRAMEGDDWDADGTFTLVYASVAGAERAAAVCFNVAARDNRFVLPQPDTAWELRLATGRVVPADAGYTLQSRSLAVLFRG